MRLILLAQSQKLDREFYGSEACTELYQLPYKRKDRLLASLEITLAWLGAVVLLVFSYATVWGKYGFLLWLTADLIIAAAGLLCHRLLERFTYRHGLQGLRLLPDSMERSELREAVQCFHSRESWFMYGAIRSDPRMGLPLSGLLLIGALICQLRADPAWQVFLTDAATFLELGLFGLYADRKYKRVKDRCADRIEELSRQKEEEYVSSLQDQGGPI